MKNFIDSIIRILIFLVIFLGILFIATVFYAYNSDSKETVNVSGVKPFIQSIKNNIINDINTSNKNSVNIIVDDITPLEPDISNTNYIKEKYYFKQLNTTSSLIYTALENNIDNLKKENFTINFEKQFNDLLHEPSGQEELNSDFQSALDAFFYDYPELFYIDLTKISLVIKSTSIGPLTTYTAKIAPESGTNYLCESFKSEQDVNLAISNLETARNTIINNISNTTDYDTLLTVHDTLVNSLEYDSTLNKPNTHNIYGALIEKSVVCEGYAKAYKYILDSLNIENILVSGTATNSSGESESHMWNYVKLNGNWYGVDVTWDDPIIIGGFSKNNLRHDYFLKGSTVFNKSHSPSEMISDSGMLFSIPTLNSLNYKK